MSDSHRRHLDEQITLHRKLSQVYTGIRYAPGYSKLYQRHWNHTLCALADLPIGARVLDFGCGTGILFPELAARGYRVIGIDLSLDMLRAGGESLNIFSVCGDGCSLPFADASFDAVFCRGSLHHVPDLTLALQETGRVLKSGGELIFSEPSNDSILNRLARRIMYRHRDDFHEGDEGLRRQPVLRVLSSLGLKVDYSRGFGFLAYTLAGFPDKIGLLGAVPGNRFLTRLLIGVDSVLKSLPIIHRLALQWMVRARKG
jgi:ubiquinone/menaquinone biosynthesis C-methylase UbiE